ncbi:hypothetical protein S1001342_02839 (plasmid) [Acetobacter pasteurianus subsp. pasteurianus]|uniref:Uncharacterized protein n=1 Tax=Acetobacter pasteurianus subsp. pasteurianus TaxID=481145 RepID=A0A1Y0Y1P7_ACEPA|nr:hypothetical protein S1001342_02839 [Acetobacter pasteurianus subsp. pasteurianus]
MKQASFLDGSSFDALTFEQDCLPPSEPDICRREIVETLVIAVLIIVFDECLDLAFEISRQIIMLKKHAVLERLVPTLDLPLCLGMVGSATHMIHAVLI